jgi:hypothetical protein
LLVAGCWLLVAAESLENRKLGSNQRRATSNHQPFPPFEKIGR